MAKAKDTTTATAAPVAVSAKATLVAAIKNVKTPKSDIDGDCQRAYFAYAQERGGVTGIETEWGTFRNAIASKKGIDKAAGELLAALDG